MSLIGNTVLIKHVIANGNEMNTVLVNGVTVFESAASITPVEIKYMMDDFSGEAVQDSGGSDYDAVLHNNSGSYSYSTSNRILTLIGDANAQSTYELPSNASWTLIQTYGVDISSGLFNMYALHYKGDGTADVWYADQNSTFSLSAENTGLLYSPPSTLSLEATLSLPKRPVATITVEPSTIDKGQTATVTVVFDTDVTGLSLSNFSAEYGTLSNFSGSGREYTMQFTPVDEILAFNNHITLDTNYTDLYGNSPSTSYQSDAYIVHTVTELVEDWNFAQGGSAWGTTGDGILINVNGAHFDTDANYVIYQLIDCTNITTLKVVTEVTDYDHGNPAVSLRYADAGFVDISKNPGPSTVYYDVTPITGEEYFRVYSSHGDVLGGKWTLKYISVTKHA